jgi:hypothetical protein
VTSLCVDDDLEDVWFLVDDLEDVCALASAVKLCVNRNRRDKGNHSTTILHHNCELLRYEDG